jgi:hypothetical protein
MASIAGVKFPSSESRSSKAPVKIGAKSSFIAEFEYDDHNLTLTTHLKNGSIYQHKMVVPSEWDALKTAKSQSKYWSDFIRGKKASVRVKAEKAPNSEIKKAGRK